MAPVSAARADSRPNRTRVAGVKWRTSWKQASSTPGSAASRALCSMCMLIGSSRSLGARSGARSAATTSNGVRVSVAGGSWSRSTAARVGRLPVGSTPGRPYR
jgi:hypothetical protein